MSFKARFDTYIRAIFPIIFVDTVETERVSAQIFEHIMELNKNIADYDTGNVFLKQNGMMYYEWDNVKGLVCINPSTKVTSKFDGTTDLREAYKIVGMEKTLPGVFVFKNVHLFWEQQYGSAGRIPGLCHMLSDFARGAGLQQNKYMVHIGSLSAYPEEFKREGVIIDFDLPNKEEIKSELIALTGAYGIKAKDKDLEDTINAASGMTMKEIRDAVKVSIIETEGEKIDPEFIFSEKSKVVKKSGLLEHIPSGKNLSDVGGLFTLKERLERVAKIYHNLEKAVKFGLPIPKGYMLVGVPGSGKTITAMAISKYLRLPLYRCNIDALFGSLVGETEKNTRELFKLVKAISPAVVMFDEIEKSMSGMQSSGASDAGVTSRMIGSFLTHMQDRDYPSFFVATANDVNSLPAPLIRKGRWDDIFFVDLPDSKEREEIVAIHLRRSGRDPKKFNIPFLAAASITLTGAEIECGVNDALAEAFYMGREINDTDLEQVFRATKGIAVTKAEEIAAVRDWAKDRARKANEPVVTSSTVKEKVGKEINEVMRRKKK